MWFSVLPNVWRQWRAQRVHCTPGLGGTVGENRCVSLRWGYVRPNVWRSEERHDEPDDKAGKACDVQALGEARLLPGRHDTYQENAKGPDAEDRGSRTDRPTLAAKKTDERAEMENAEEHVHDHDRETTSVRWRVEERQEGNAECDTEADEGGRDRSGAFQMSPPKWIEREM